MPGVVREGDVNGGGGVCFGGVQSVLVNGRPIAVPGMTVTPHLCCGLPGCIAHCIAKTSKGSASALGGFGGAIASFAGLGFVATTAISVAEKAIGGGGGGGGGGKVFAGGKPVVVKGDGDTCGHARASASGDVIIG
jgi:hypothetical protein